MARKRKRHSSSDSFGRLKEGPFPVALIRRYFNRKDHSSAFQVISDKTCNDLDFDALFMFLDRSVSVVGQQYLYHRLRTLPEAAQCEEREPLIAKLSTDTTFRLQVQQQLKKLSKPEVYYLQDLFQGEHLQEPRWFSLLPFLSVALLLSLVLMFFSAAMIFVVLALIITNTGIHYWNKRNLYQYAEAIPQLVKLNTVAKQLFKLRELRSLHPSLPKCTAEIDKLRNRMLLFRTEAGMDDLRAVFAWILELLKAIFLLEPMLLFNVLKRLDRQRREIEKVFEFVGEVDILLSIASLRAGLESWCKPEFVRTVGNIQAEAVYHPLIPECVKNSIELNGRSVLLTGSNMSGKTSFIRTIGINALTASTLNTCFAQKFQLPRMKIHSAIRISDDLLNDRSYYFEEVLTIKKMLAEATGDIPSLFLLDEIFKGTNTVERIAAGKAVLSFLSGHGNTVFVSTHDVELADLLSSEYDLYHFSETLTSGSIDFDYKLKTGKVQERNAIRILEVNSYPKEVISEAVKIASGLDSGQGF